MDCHDYYHVKFPSVNLNAYGDGLCSLLASFEFQEGVSYNLEIASNIYVCPLDSSSDFATVWYKCYFYKLYHKGVK